jgi:predicted ester cyclase
MTITHLRATDDHVFIEARCDGQNTGNFGSNPATNRTIHFQFTGVYDITNGKITKATFDYDEASVTQQLGIPSLK